MKIPINIPDIDKEEIREVTAVLSEKSLTSSSFEGGKRVQQFEKLLSKFVKSKFAVAVNSGTAALQACLYAIDIKPGDEVLVPSFTFVATANSVKSVGAKPVFVNTDLKKQFEPDSSDLKRKINKKTKGIIINSPSNPTGGVWSNEAILETLKICNHYNLWIYSDECDEQLTYNEPFQSIASLTQENKEIITFQSCSRTYAMTG